MPRRGLSLLLALAMVSIASAKPKLEDLPAYQLGLDALASQLWEIATTRFTTALETPELDPALRSQILLRLVETHVRAGQTDAALKFLADPALAKDPARPFWTAQAQAAAGRFAEAIATLDAGGLDPKSPFLTEALLTKAGIQRALGDADGALATTDSLLKRSSNSTRARLLKAQILIAQEKPADALKVIPDPAKLKGTDAKQAAFLLAQAQLASGDAEKATTGYAKLLESPEGQTLDRYHSASLGLARAQLAAGDRAAAGDALLAFIQQNPRSPLLNEAFDVLMECLPEQPAPNDAILNRIREWIPAATVNTPAYLTTDNGAASAWPTPATVETPLAPQALYHLALGLRREGSPDSLATARRLLDRLRLDYPTHPLVASALLENGRWDLEDDRRAQATACFEALDHLGNASPPELRAQGLSLEGTARFNEGDFEGAAAVFDRAAALLESEQRQTARLNAATALLAGGSIAAFNNLAKDIEDPALGTSLALERALFLASFRDPEAFPALRSFVELNPDHPRIAEARLAAALAAINVDPPDTDFATTQLALLDPDARATLPPSSLALAQIRLHERLAESEKAIAAARDFLVAHPDDPRHDDLVFELGRAHFLGGNYNDAQLALAPLISEDANTPRAAASLLISARSAALGATPQAQAESIALFDKLIETESPFTDVARLEKADLLIRLSRLDEAVATLAPWFKKMKKGDPLLLSVGHLLWDALFAQAQGKPEELEKSTTVLDRLLADLPTDSPSRYRVLYQKGLTFEQIPGGEEKAIQAYYSVLESAAEKPGGDWKAIELCGFSALRILEKAKRWPAAIELAEKVAALKGPRSEEAAKRAKSLRLDHMYWPD